MKLAIGSDHVGFELKPVIIEYLEELGHEVTRVKEQTIQFMVRKWLKRLQRVILIVAFLSVEPEWEFRFLLIKLKVSEQSFVANLILQDYLKNTITQIFLPLAHGLSVVSLPK